MVTEVVHQVLDIRQDTCPITFVKTKLKLEQMQVGGVLEVFLAGGEALQNVPRSVKAEGHRVVKVENLGDNQYRLLIECGYPGG